MRAVVVTEQAVKVQDVKQPEPKPNEVLVQVKACWLYRADLMVASGVPEMVVALAQNSIWIKDRTMGVDLALIVTC